MTGKILDPILPIGNEPEPTPRRQLERPQHLNLLIWLVLNLIPSLIFLDGGMRFLTATFLVLGGYLSLRNITYKWRWIQYAVIATPVFMLMSYYSVFGGRPGHLFGAIIASVSIQVGIGKTDTHSLRMAAILGLLATLSNLAVADASMQKLAQWIVLLSAAGNMAWLHYAQTLEGTGHADLRRMIAWLGKQALILAPAFLLIGGMAMDAANPQGFLRQLTGSTKQLLGAVSDEMTPAGNELDASNGEALAFVVHSRELPNNGENYWRTTVFDQFNGRTWKQARTEEDPATVGSWDRVRQIAPSGTDSDPFLYAMGLTPEFQGRIPTLGTPTAFLNAGSDASQGGIVVMPAEQGGENPAERMQSGEQREAKPGTVGNPLDGKGSGAPVQAQIPAGLTGDRNPLLVNQQGVIRDRTQTPGQRKRNAFPVYVAWSWVPKPGKDQIQGITSPIMAGLPRPTQDEIRDTLLDPGNRNPQTIAWARQLRERSKDEHDFILKVSDHFRKNFTYTTKPARTGRNPVDDLMFSTHDGYCEHFSSAFATIMRAGGIPTRVVGGFSGAAATVTIPDANGRQTALDVTGQDQRPIKTYLIRNRLAHAWTEAWVDGKWVRIDPTGFVINVRDRLDMIGRKTSEPNPWIARFGQFSEWMGNSNKKREEIFSGNLNVDAATKIMKGLESRTGQIAILVALGLAVLTLVLLRIRVRKRDPQATQKLILEWQKAVNRLSDRMPILPGDTPFQIVQAAPHYLTPDSARQLTEISEWLEHAIYAPGGHDETGALGRRIKKWKPQWRGK